VRLTRITFEVYSSSVYFFFSKVVILIVFFVGLYFTSKLFIGLFQDTTTITNIAFGIIATLSALCFSCSRAILNSHEDKDKFTFAGERFFHVAVLLIIASILKYGSIALGIVKTGDGHSFDVVHVAISVLSAIPGFVVGILFFWALISAHGGLVVLNRLLWNRHNRFKDWNDFF